MILLFIAVSLLLVATLILFYFPWREGAKVDQDGLNRMLYQARLQELEDENSGSSQSMVVELQRTLLADSREATVITRRPLRRWVLLPGALMLVLMSLGIFFHDSDFDQLMRWQRAQRQLCGIQQSVHRAKRK
ncbi:MULTISPECIES: c-type cytochrome biogenesis protein CcmI [Klebsiella/Raoultella group]|uniref:c-type cytochrome biogenesis protein CcmI n=1 Tax=Klebsiella/Raoultella group TaxID=2890311 RepID=UPI00100A0313|nr:MULTISPECIES: c-type cytochrome biogenesis protein CcmI [Klebsiella/Raoultella group]KAB7536389.1 c-type cytochrome biogenesis protein CcmI [Klebsiella pneumoniae]QAV82106.1 c-type cytochrome biogenesis protein CcmI [Klebsiella pneumoniae]WFW01856.1 c-type cytochrome biogenesis protein CcmI [Klebsiella aerogenes]WSI10856.1 c-type cytochrome biogenesis protein CcmI [Klebsiella pneumoniae]